MACTPVRMCLSLGIFGVILLWSGVMIGWVVVPEIVRIKIAEILPLKQNTDSWDRWVNIPVPIQYRIFIFNVTNPKEILEGEMPKVTEIGPYVYNEKRIKTILSVDEEKSSAMYKQKFIFEFDPNASAPLAEDDVLRVANVPAMLFGLVVDNLKEINPIIRMYGTAMEKMWPTVDSNPLFIEVKVKDYLFKGIPILCNQTVTTDNIDTVIMCEGFKILNVKTTVFNDLGKGVHSFSFFKYKNNSDDGIYKIDLGIRDVTKIGQILSWNNFTSVSVWKGESCNKIMGTDATVYRPYLEEDGIKSLYIYHSDICRSVKLSYGGESEFKGVKGRRYVSDKSFLASVLEDSDNHCFCPQSIKKITHYGGCLRSGVLELSNCQGVPVIISYPHFLMADPLYQGKVEGLKPNIEKHGIFMDLEPNTGYPLRGVSRIQINSFLKSIPEVRFMKNLTNVLMPNIWFEERIELTDELIDMVNSQLLNILKIVNVLRWSMIVVGIILSIGSCGYYYFKIKPSKI